MQRERGVRRGTAARALAVGAAVVSLSAACAGTSGQQVASDPEPEETTTSTTTTTRPPDCASTLPTPGKAAQLLMVMVSEPAEAAEYLAGGLVSGFGLKGNQRSDVDVAIAEATEDAPLPATVAVDEEGGTVQRLRYSAGRIPSAADMGEGTAQDAASTFEEHAARMTALGVTMNFAPVADLAGEEDDVLGSRTYGDDPEVVGDFAAAVATANSDGGITPVVKHWPGMGGAQEDPHDSLPTLAPIEELRARDMVPFRTTFAAGAPAVMVAHAEVPGLTAEGEPTSLSRAAVTDELRGREGFGGVVMTDSLGMGAVVEQMSQPEAAERAIAAGVDVALVSGGDVVRDTHARLVEAIEEGRIPAAQVEESVRRALALRGIEGECFDGVSAYAALGREAADAAAEQQADTDGTDTDGTDTDGTDTDTDGTDTDGTDTDGTDTDGTDTDGTDTAPDSGINDAD